MEANETLDAILGGLIRLIQPRSGYRFSVVSILRVGFVFVAARAAEMISELRERSLEPKRIRMVHPRALMGATTMLVEARKGGGIELKVEPPLVLYERPGVYTAEAETILRGEG